MAADEARMRAMRGEPEESEKEDDGKEKEEGPSESRMQAARRFAAAMAQKNWRAMVAAFDDMDEDAEEPEEEEEEGE